jgi:TonB family protein
LDQRIAANVQRGMNQSEAEGAARRQFGDVARVKDGMREVRMMSKRVVGAFAAGLSVGALIAAVLFFLFPRAQEPANYRVGQEGVSAPVPVHEVKPQYTSEALRAKIAGTVVLTCVVQPSGICNDVHVTKSLDLGLDQQAVNALLGWRFQPGERLGKTVPVLVTIDMTFTWREKA